MAFGFPRLFRVRQVVPPQESFSLVLNDLALASGVRPADIFLPKIEDEILQADLRKAAAIPSKSILFNIDQKFDGIKVITRLPSWKYSSKC